MIRTCPVHGEGNHYKHTLEMMQAQAHAYAYSCFSYFQNMAKGAKSRSEQAYYQQQASIAGCMVHGPHGISPIGIPHAPPMYGQSKYAAPYNYTQPPYSPNEQHNGIPQKMDELKTGHDLHLCCEIKDEVINPESVPYDNEHHEKDDRYMKHQTVDKIGKEEYFIGEEDPCIHNTTGNKDRKRRKIPNTLTLQLSES